MRAFRLILGMASVLFFSGCAARYEAQSEFVMGTVCSLTLYKDGSPELYGRLFGRLRELDSVFNNYSESSEITEVNEKAANGPVSLRQDFYTVLKTAIDFSQVTGGAFDPTVGPLIRLWSIGKKNHIPTEEELRNTLPLVDYKSVVLQATSDGTEYAGKVSFAKEGIQLDLGGIAKGYAADELVRICREEKVRQAVISLGGNVYVYGRKRTSPGKSSLWSVAVRDPNFGGEAKASFVIETKDATVVTSGGYERYFEKDGKIYSHILNPWTGFPAESGLKSVTIVSQKSITADALSTSIFLLGMDKIAELQESPVCGNFECLCITDSGEAYATAGLKDRLKSLDKSIVKYF